MEPGKGFFAVNYNRAFLLLISLVFLCLAILTFNRNLDYRTEVSLWTSAVQVDPLNPRAHLGLGSAALREGPLDLVEPSFLKAIELSHPGRDLRFEALNNLAVLYQRQGQRQKAVDSFRQILNLAPNYQPAIFNLSLLLLEGEVPGSSGFQEGSKLIQRLAQTLPATDSRLLTLLIIRSLRTDNWREALNHLARLGSAGLSDSGTWDLWVDLLSGVDPVGFSEAMAIIEASGANPAKTAAAAADNLKSRGKLAEAKQVLLKAAANKHEFQ